MTQQDFQNRIEAAADEYYAGRITRDKLTDSMLDTVVALKKQREDAVHNADTTTGGR